VNSTFHKLTLLSSVQWYILQFTCCVLVFNNWNKQLNSPVWKLQQAFFFYFFIKF